MHLRCQMCFATLMIAILCLESASPLLAHNLYECSFSSMTECYLQQLGPPRTPQEWLMAYISAITERCFQRPEDACNRDHACTLVNSFYPEEGAEYKAAPDPAAWVENWLHHHGLEDNETETVCRPDILRVLGKSCKWSRGDMLTRCGGHTTAGECRRDTACLWLRNGWWLDSGGNQASDENATFFSGLEPDLSVMLQGGVPPSYACWPKWHVPYAAQAWPRIQYKGQAEPLVCPILAMEYPCNIFTEASLQVAKLAELLTSTAPCIDILGIKGTCPHLDLAHQVVARLWKGWELPVELWSARTVGIMDLCEPVARLFNNHSHHTRQMAAPWALPYDPGAWQSLQVVSILSNREVGPPVVSLKHLYGADCVFEGGYFASYAPVDLPVQCRDIIYKGLFGRDCNMQTVDERRSKDDCVRALVGRGLWGEFAVAVLAPSSKTEGGFWLKGLAQAGQRCGTLDWWHKGCWNISLARQHAYLNKLVGDYERLFLTDSDAAGIAKISNLTYACSPEIVATYKSLAAAWIAYAGVTVLGLVGLAVHWCSCGRRLRARQAAAALRRLLASQRGVPAPQRTTLQKVWSTASWAMPRLRAAAFVVDLGLDVYTLVQLWSSRWFSNMLTAILLPYMVMGLLVGPGFGKLGRSDYPYLLLSVCACSCCCWPAIWWLDVRMFFSLMGVQLPCCGESRMAMGQYTDLRMLFQGLFEALLSALVSTAVLYDKLAVQSGLEAVPVTLLWVNLVSSFSRGLVEAWKLAVQTHAHGNWCFVTTITDMVWDMLPLSDSVSPSPQLLNTIAVTTAPTPLVMTASAIQQQQKAQGVNNDDKDVEDQCVVAKPSTHEDVTPDSRVIHCGCKCCCCWEGVAAPKCSTYRWVLAWVWLWVVGISVVVVLMSVSIGCVGALVPDGYLKLGAIVLPLYRFAGDTTCGAGSLFGALHNGPSASCTLPNLVAGNGEAP